MSGDAFDAAARALLGAHWLDDPAAHDPYVLDWRRRYPGRARAVALPGSTGEVAALVRLCAAHGVPIVPQGGNTGLVGGSVPDETGRAVVLSLRRLNRIRAIDTANDTLVAEAGCPLAAVQAAAAAADRAFPLSLASEGSCTIGGNLATNAGGTQVLRWGNAREQCLGLEVVTASGEIWDGLRGLRKDNTGYDLRDLFIGSEGTLGIITAAVMKLQPRPAAVMTALAACGSPAYAVALLGRARRLLGDALTGFELMSDTCLRLVATHFPGPQPLPASTPWAVLLETSDAESESHARERFEALLSAALEAGEITDAAIAQSGAQSAAFWAVRERISEAQSRDGPNLKHDVSLPVSAIPAFVDAAGRALSDRVPGVRPVVFGHVGDGNLHYNVAGPVGTDAAAWLGRQAEIAGIVHELVERAGGSISAEHGIGRLKRDALPAHRGDVAIGLMRAIKRALDPAGILNPGKVL